MRTSQRDVNNRQQEILRRINEYGEFRSESFAEENNVSLMTVRRDLQQLENQGLLKRTHGGAVALKQSPEKYADFSEDVNRCRDVISKFSASFVNDGDVLFINGSRTALYMLKYVMNKSVTVYTNNGWAISETFPEGISIRIVGGVLQKRIMVGEMTMRNLLDLRADKTFIGCHAVYDDGEFSYSIPTEIGINEAMIGRTREHLYILADHTKLLSHEKRDLSYGSCSYGRPFTLITDSKADPSIIENLKLRGMEIIVVPAG